MMFAGAANVPKTRSAQRPRAHACAADIEPGSRNFTRSAKFFAANAAFRRSIDTLGRGPQTRTHLITGGRSSGAVEAARLAPCLITEFKGTPSLRKTNHGGHKVTEGHRGLLRMVGGLRPPCMDRAASDHKRLGDREAFVIARRSIHEREARPCAAASASAVFAYRGVTGECSVVFVSSCPP